MNDIRKMYLPINSSCRIFPSQSIAYHSLVHTICCVFLNILFPASIVLPQKVKNLYNFIKVFASCLSLFFSKNYFQCFLYMAGGKTPRGKILLLMDEKYISEVLTEWMVLLKTINNHSCLLS